MEKSSMKWTPNGRHTLKLNVSFLLDYDSATSGQREPI